MTNDDLRKCVGRVLRKTGLYNPVMKSIHAFWRCWGGLSGRNERLFAQYMNQAAPHKLHIGCGTNYLEGWFNTDLYPNKRRAGLNATRWFPYPDASFDYVFSEHMIEHVPYHRGYVMLSEAFRVLKPGGTLRIVTPDICFLIGLYQNEDNDLHRAYTKWNAELFIGDRAPHNPVSVVNNFFRDWGHQYIYDFYVMRDTLAKIGFVEIVRGDLKKSAHSALQNLEHDERIPSGFLELESMVIEAKKSI